MGKVPWPKYITTNLRIVHRDELSLEFIFILFRYSYEMGGR